MKRAIRVKPFKHEHDYLGEFPVCRAGRHPLMAYLMDKKIDAKIMLGQIEKIIR